MPRHWDLWCGSCRLWRDRDVVAAMNIACKRLHRFCNPKGGTCEAMRGNPEGPAILRVDVSKLVTDWGSANAQVS